MKKYNQLLIISVVLYFILAAGSGIFLCRQQKQDGQFYKVEINRIIAELEKPEDVERISLSAYKHIKNIAYLPVSETDKETMNDFYDGTNALESAVRPFYIENQMKGYLRFDYKEESESRGTFLLTEGVLLFMELFLLSILFYLRGHLIQPFDRMQELTYELSKGNLQGEIKAEKNRYLGKFLWGVGQLKDALYVSRKRELELQKEKKLLMLSLSHDIKTPLSMIKLYSKALEEDMYGEEKDKKDVYRQIGEKTTQIENYVNEIVKASREDILHIEIEKGEFYFKDFVEKVTAVYGEKCALRKCELFVGNYKNRLFSGDFNRLFEVFENLFENAFKYGDGRRIELTFYEEDYCQLIRIFNTGEPVTENDFAHLFDSFFRGENVAGKQGNGLGLYICKEIMHKMGGEIFAEREESGMAFVVVLPM